MQKFQPKFNILPPKPSQDDAAPSRGRFPSWLHRTLPKGSELVQTKETLTSHRLPTVCEEAKCPNLLECFSKKTATFLVLGKHCTRACGFCDILHDKAPPPPQQDEPQRLAQSVQDLGLEHVVITMVARDDLEDGGSKHLGAIVDTLHLTCPGTTIELLTSDFQGNRKALDDLLDKKPDIFNHNIETVQRLTPSVRHKATYQRSLDMLAHASEHTNIPIKSGLMLGLGETEQEVVETLKDLHRVGVSIVTIGQYLQPNRKKLYVKEFIHPDQFQRIRELAQEIGIPHVYSGPFVRSSYHAKEVFSWTTR